MASDEINDTQRCTTCVGFDHDHECCRLDFERMIEKTLDLSLAESEHAIDVWLEEQLKACHDEETTCVAYEREN